MKILFIDRDDTVIVNKDYLDDPAGIEFLPGAIEGLKAFMDKGYKLVMITNQSGIARGYFTIETLEAIHQRMLQLLAQQGVELLKIYYCPHGPEDDCDCRKPRTGMLKQAGKDFSFDHEAAAMIGDSKADIHLARNFGITAIQVTNGRQDATVIPEADYVCNTILEASQLPIFP